MFTHFYSYLPMVATVTIIVIINLFYQLGTERRTQKARPVQGAYCLHGYVYPCLPCYLCLSKYFTYIY